METYATVNLGALARNLTAIQSFTQCPILLPVKANAYGHGLIAPSPSPGLDSSSIASSLVTSPLISYAQDHQLVEWLGVATVAEGVKLRQAGITLPILKLSHSAPADLPSAMTAHLTLTVIDDQTVRQAEQGAHDLGTSADVHLKIDTGMRRIGAEPTDAARLAHLIESSPYLNLTGIFTHVAASEDPNEDTFTHHQLDLFDTAVADAQEEVGRPIQWIHAANSGAVLRHPRSWYNLVRPGIASFGYAPSTSGPDGDPLTFGPDIHLEPVMSLVSHISFIKTVRLGETVSYGRTWMASRDTTIGTIPIGYGDGYSRRLSNKAHVLIRGHRYPQVGTICMDQMMVDLGPHSDIAVGEQVTLIGRDGEEHIGADDLGSATNTISYEIVCAIADRVPRVYIVED